MTSQLIRYFGVNDQLVIFQMSKKIDAHILAKYKVGQLIGSGAYGHVWKAEDRATHKQYALKKVFGAFRNNIDAQRTYREVEILQKIDHPNIIKLQKVLGAENKEDLYMIFQLMEADLLAVVGNSILSYNHHKYVLFQIIKALSYLHQLQLIHRDLKPSNVLLDSDCHIKLCDFGLVRSLAIAEQEHPILSEEVATRWYRAPQLLLSSRTYSYPADLWSVGCIAAEILTGKPLFDGNSSLEQLEKIIEFTGGVSQEDLESLDSPVVECLVSQIKPKYKTFADYFGLVNHDFYPLLRGLLKFNPKQRLTAKEALSLDLFKEFLQERQENQQLTKAVIPQLDDNKRFNLRDYRNKIYSKIPKKLRAPSAHKDSSLSGLFKNESIKRINKKKVLSKTVESQPKSQDLHKQRHLSKTSQKSSSIQKKRLSQGIVSSSKKREEISSAPHFTKSLSPYKQEIKRLQQYCTKQFSVGKLKSFEKKLPHLKKKSNKEGKVVKFKKI